MEGCFKREIVAKGIGKDKLNNKKFVDRTRQREYQKFHNCFTMHLLSVLTSLQIQITPLQCSVNNKDMTK